MRVCREGEGWVGGVEGPGSLPRPPQFFKYFFLPSKIMYTNLTVYTEGGGRGRGVEGPWPPRNFFLFIFFGFLTVPSTSGLYLH